ncbi:hypothetical protein SUGI_0891230 [Cryptomeria japonica]|nr:hypothetical protein SUGI_0891230 [Cryptomeria japonica]
MGQAVSTFFSVTVVNAAKNAWATVVSGVTAFATWVKDGVMSFVNSVINSITGVLESVKNFFIRAWNNVVEFTNKIFYLKPNPKDYVYDYVYEIGKEMSKAGIEHMRQRLKELGQNDIDNLSDEEVEKKWKQYMSNHPLTPEEEQDLKDTFGKDFDSDSSKTMSSKFRSPPVTGFAATSPQEAEEFKLRKDHVITHVTFVLLSPEQFKIGRPKPVSLTPDEEQELNRLLSS